MSYEQEQQLGQALWDDFGAISDVEVEGDDESDGEIEVTVIEITNNETQEMKEKKVLEKQDKSLKRKIKKEETEVKKKLLKEERENKKQEKAKIKQEEIKLKQEKIVTR
ncbi:hypothetical protein QE152_g24547 [Popillia japonica]|uniref:Uncharacterized protein n=1 Tax=Popillia japonica TaxID=7064 RepID=A0AAW1KEN9_POPJA